MKDTSGKVNFCKHGHHINIYYTRYTSNIKFGYLFLLHLYNITAMFYVVIIKPVIS